MSAVRAPAAHHLISLRVENRAGVLVRVAGLFSRRGFNIVSLAVAPTEDERFSRVAIVVDAESAPLQQVVDQLDKLINVVELTELHPDEAREVELLLVTVANDGDRRAAVAAAAATAGATVLDSDAEAAMLMLAAAPAALDALETELRGIGIVALQRTGRIALPMLGRPHD